MTLNDSFGKLLHRFMLRHWKRVSRLSPDAELASLRARRQQARQLSIPLQELITIADSRLAIPRIGSTTFPRPAGTDWAWRPMVWRAGLTKRGLAPALNKAKIGDEIVVFHDCTRSEIAITQQRNRREDDLAPYGLTVETYHFDGSFLSLALDLPDAACVGLQKRHIVQLSALISREAPITIYARLNVKHGPNTEQVMLTLPHENGEISIAFDLAYTQLNEKRTEKMWIDLMFENPAMNNIVIRDLHICRYPRAAI